MIEASKSACMSSITALSCPTGFFLSIRLWAHEPIHTHAPHINTSGPRSATIYLPWRSFAISPISDLESFCRLISVLKGPYTLWTVSKLSKKFEGSTFFGLQQQHLLEFFTSEEFWLRSTMSQFARPVSHRFRVFNRLPGLRQVRLQVDQGPLLQSQYPESALNFSFL